MSPMRSGAPADRGALSVGCRRREAPLTSSYVVLVTIDRTQVIDVLSNRLEVCLRLSATVHSRAAGSDLCVWYSIERALLIHTIVTPHRRISLHPPCPKCRLSVVG